LMGTGSRFTSDAVRVAAAAVVAAAAAAEAEQGRELFVATLPRRSAR
jgi:hypothetical protein